MNEKILYSYTGIFDSPDAIIKATEKVSEKGYKKYDVHTPYPLHGMNKAMKLPPSKLGYVALVVGLSGALSALLLMFWMSAVDYPVVIGGKPLFSFPAYVPVIFEVTVLSASIATVLTMLFIFFKLPNNKHPLHDTEYMKNVASDKYGISIQAEDEKFNEAEVIKLLEECGAKNITAIYYDEEEINHKHKILEPKFIGFLLFTALLTSGVSYLTLNKILYMPPFNWMMEQNKLNPQSTSTIFADGFGMRNPVEGTVSRGYLPYPYKGQPEAAGTNLINPLPVTKQILDIGQKKFDIYCSPCHGYNGEGDSRLRGQFPNPPSLHSEKVRTWSDGRIFHVITDGQNVMPSYSSQLNADEKWAVVHYIRALQRALNAKESDLQ
ncbi:MAG: quinol:electron acceptor oxidoreductase subunit ActD [Bacteroidota bacterium]